MDSDACIRASDANSVASYGNPNGSGVTTDSYGVRYLSPAAANFGGNGYFVVGDDDADADADADRASITHYGGHTIAYYDLGLNANRGPHLLPRPHR